MLNSFAAPLQGYMPCFITLTYNDRLRGYSGSLAAHAPLISDAVTNRIKAATGDSRFTPLTTRHQLAKLRMKVTVLAPRNGVGFQRSGRFTIANNPRRFEVNSAIWRKARHFSAHGLRQLARTEKFLKRAEGESRIDG